MPQLILDGKDRRHLLIMVYSSIDSNHTFGQQLQRCYLTSCRHVRCAWANANQTSQQPTNMRSCPD